MDDSKSAENVVSVHGQWQQSPLGSRCSAGMLRTDPGISVLKADLPRACETGDPELTLDHRDCWKIAPFRVIGRLN